MEYVSIASVLKAKACMCYREKLARDKSSTIRRRDGFVHAKIAMQLEQG